MMLKCQLFYQKYLQQNILGEKLYKTHTGVFVHVTSRDLFQNCQTP